ncbi:MAG: LpxL/LpxP family Kdo(2)-lipid IV(A) lauroyl/palmitoleoyl acyltransferase [Oceanipulchritudo sp.]
MAAPRSSSLWIPGNALAALGIGILKLSARAPLPVMQKIGRGIGTLAALLFPYRKSVGRTNLRLCFPELPEKDRKRLLRRHYQAMGIGIFELGAAWYKSDREIQTLGTVTGLEHLRAVEESGRGALLLTAHFTTLEIAGRILNSHHAFSCLYRKPDQPVIAKTMTRLRESRMRRVIHFDQMNELIRALREGEFIWYAPDQGKRIKYSAILPFFGVPAVTNTATGRIARMGRAAILPFFGYRRGDGRYQVEIFPELTDIPSKDPEADAVRINHLIEGFIRKAPDQYFWLHRRFKRRGPEYGEVYP